MSAPELPKKGQVEALTPLAPEFDAAASGLDIVADQMDLLGRVAETSNAARRGAGRPAGSVNRRNAATFDYLEALGYKGPERMLMQLISAETKTLARELGAEPLDVLKLQVKAAADLLPYKLARKPQLHQVEKRELHLFVSGDLSQEELEKMQQNQWADLRDGDNAAHDPPIIEADQ